MKRYNLTFKELVLGGFLISVVSAFFVLAIDTILISEGYFASPGEVISGEVETVDCSSGSQMLPIETICVVVLTNGAKFHTFYIEKYQKGDTINIQTEKRGLFRVQVEP